MNKSKLITTLNNPDKSFWQNHLAECHKQGLNHAQYSRLHGLSYHSLKYQHLKKQKTDKDFIKVNVSDVCRSISSDRAITHCTVELSNGNRLMLQSEDSLKALPYILDRIAV